MWSDVDGVVVACEHIVANFEVGSFELDCSANGPVAKHVTRLPSRLHLSERVRDQAHATTMNIGQHPLHDVSPSSFGRRAIWSPCELENMLIHQARPIEPHTAEHRERLEVAAEEAIPNERDS